MNDRSGLLTLVAYATAAMLLALVALLGVFRLGALTRVTALEPIPAESAPTLAVSALPVSGESRQPIPPTKRLESRRVELLEAMLSDKASLVRAQALKLEKQAADLEDIRERYETAMMVVEAFQAEIPVDMSEAPLALVDDENEEDEPIDPERMEAELMLARAVHDALVTDLDDLQDELAIAYERIDQLAENADESSAVLLKDALALEAASAAILRQLGQDAVPALVEALSNADPVIRTWSASVLGSIGRDAGDAADALTETLSDPDPGVRQAAKRALDKVEN